MLEDPEGLVTRLWPTWLENREKSKEWQDWALGRQQLPAIPDSATNEYRSLQEKAITPWLGLVVQAFVQSLIVDGFRSSGASDDSMMWAVWQANRMDARQAVVYDGAVTTGMSYVAVLPTATPARRRQVGPMVDGAVSVPEWRPYSSAQMSAFFDSPHDDFPEFAIAAEPAPQWRQHLGHGPAWRATLIDESHVYLLDVVNGVAGMIEEPRPHGLSTTPVVSYTNRRTITGRAIGEVEPYVAIASRIDQDVFDRLVVQRFAAWRVRWATGLTIPATDEDQAAQDLALKVSDILLSDSPDTQFGSLPATEMTGHLRAPMEDVRHLSAVAQVPPTILTADLTNISAEALAAVDSAFNRKVEHLKEELGESHEKAFALSAEAMGLDVDHSAQVRWKDMDARSLTQTTAAYGTVVRDLGVPAEVMWDKLPFLTDQDRQRARQLVSERGGIERLLAEIADATDPSLAE